MQVIAAIICRALLPAILSLFAFHAFADEAARVHIVDGDTLDIGNVRYRLHRIDAPELGQKCKSAIGGTWRCGAEASKALRDLVQGGSLLCDNRGKDIIGRTLSVCTIKGVDINAAMISRGMAWSFKKYSHDYDEIEEIAKAKLVGVWQAETETAWDFRAHKWEDLKQQAPNGCPIKGNISSKGEHIYHLPWTKVYTKTRINEKKGERWFCSEGEAIEAGWRPPN